MPNGDKYMKRISHITNTTALKTLLYPSFLSPSTPNITRFFLRIWTRNAPKTHLKKAKTILKTAQTKRNSTQKKRGSTKTQRENEPYTMNKNRMNKAIRHPY